MSLPGMTISPGLMSKRTAGGNDSFVKLLLHAEGTDGATTITDSSSVARTGAVFNGPAAIKTAQKKFGSASLFFGASAGAGGFVTYPYSADFDFGTGDFTIDAWIYQTAQHSPYWQIAGGNGVG